jgi:hypothetical protein
MPLSSSRPKRFEFSINIKSSRRKALRKSDADRREPARPVVDQEPSSRVTSLPCLLYVLRLAQYGGCRNGIHTRSQGGPTSMHLSCCMLRTRPKCRLLVPAIPATADTCLVNCAQSFKWFTFD